MQSKAVKVQTPIFLASPINLIQLSRDSAKYFFDKKTRTGVQTLTTIEKSKKVIEI